MGSVIFNPTADFSTMAREMASRAPLEGKNGVLLDIHKAGSDVVLSNIGKTLEVKEGVSNTTIIRKGSAHNPLPPDVLSQIAAQSHFAIVGVGD